MHTHSREREFKPYSRTAVKRSVVMENKSNQCGFLTVDKQSGVSRDLLKGLHVRRDAIVNSTVKTGHVMQHQRILI